MEDFLLSPLNEKQREAVTATEGFFRIVAGAGTGKTKTLAHRFAYLVSELGVSPKNILCVTFTNKAATEMKRRIRRLIGDQDMGYISTFHGFCVQVLHEDIYALNYPKNFIILDDEDINCILKEIFEKFKVNTKYLTIKQAREYITIAKGYDSVTLLTDPNGDSLNKKRQETIDIKQKIFYEYLYEQRKNLGLDFDDLILFTLYIFEKNPDIRIKWQERLNYIMVDEFQDIDTIQYTLVSILSKYHKNLFIVGDPDQTIYSWRGAKVELFMEFDKVFPTCTTIVMDRNYRSHSAILNASNSLIRNNLYRIDKNLYTTREKKEDVTYYHAKTIQEESNWIAKAILQLTDNGYKLSDIAILYRGHHVTRSIEEGLLNNNIPYMVYSGVGFYQRKEIKDILSYLRLIVNGDDIAFKRVINEPKRTFGKKKLEILQKYADEHKISLLNALYETYNTFGINSIDAFVALIKKYSAIYKNIKLSEFFISVLDESGYEEYLRSSGEEERLENLAELKQSIFDYEKNAGEFVDANDYLNHISLFTNIDKEDSKNRVKLMTIHTAKGLEFPIVFVCALNEGIFPSSKIQNKDELEEERRLAYVAFTRAMDYLFLTDAEGITFSGGFRYPSRFIFNTKKENLKYIIELNSDFIEESNGYILLQEKFLDNEKKQFNIGDKVEHKKLGIGVVQSFDKEKSTYKILFEQYSSTRELGMNAPLVKIY